MQKPELLMPAGSLQKMQYAYAYGADAVYLGVPYFSLRARENEFSLEDLYTAREISNKKNKKIYLTVNIFSKNRKLKPFEKQLEDLVNVRPDAFIMSDPGLMAMTRERYPDVDIHLSVQANCMNWKSVKFWKESLGVTRVILSRELNINDIAEIKQRVPDVELEAFVHGSICIAYSGRCLMSSYMSHRDANQGVCDNSCREKFKLHTDTKPSNETFYLEDLRSKEPQLYPMVEDENGTYLMNAKDLRLIEHLKQLHDVGVCSFKIEGRTKSVNYVSLVSKVYRQAIDDFTSGNKFDNKLLDELDKVANRGYTTGFMINESPGPEAQNYNTSLSRNFQQMFAGLIKTNIEIQPGYVAVEVRNRVQLGQECEILSPNDKPFIFKVTEILDKEKTATDSAHGGAGLYYFKLPENKKFNQYSIMSLKLDSQTYYGKN